MKGKKKVLLVFLPFWTPMIPPLGITGIKSYLQLRGIRVKTADANIEEKYKAIYYEYFECMRGHIPPGKRGNYFSIGTDVLRNHLMAHIHYKDEKKYIELIKILIAKTYFTDVDDSVVYKMTGIVVKFYDWLEGYMLGLLRKEEPDVLGLCVNRDILPAAMFCFRLTRKKYPHIKTVMGGAIFSEQLILDTPDMDFFLEKTRGYIDKIFIGQGELLFLNYLQGNLPESQRVYTAKDINNQIVSFRDLPLPDYGDIDISRYPYLGFTGSISCPYQCSFCNVVPYFGKFRQKDASQMADEMQRLYEIYGSQVFYFSDNMVNTFIFDLARECLHRDRAVYWTAYLKIDDHGSDLTNTLLWRQGGFYNARLGIESGSQRVLDMMDKRITIQQSKDMIVGLAKAGIKTTTYWLVGHPGETEEDFQQTLDFLTEYKKDIWEAECDYFNFNYSGQAHSGKWSENRVPVYPEEAREMLIINKWALDQYPPRHEMYNRVSRFVRHCNKLGIPNPYSLKEIFRADQRWKELHLNAVPSLVELRDEKKYIDECRYLKNLEVIDVQKNLEFSAALDW